MNKLSGILKYSPIYILLLLSLACSISNPFGNEKGSDLLTENTKKSQLTSENKLPTLSEIVTVLENNGFTMSSNGKYAKNKEEDITANLDIGCGLRIVIKFENTKSSDRQISQVRNVLITLYPNEIREYFDKYVDEISEYAKEGSEIYFSAPTLELQGFTVDFSNIAYKHEIQIAIQNLCGSS